MAQASVVNTGDKQFERRLASCKHRQKHSHLTLYFEVLDCDYFSNTEQCCALISIFLGLSRAVSGVFGRTKLNGNTCHGGRNYRECIEMH